MRKVVVPSKRCDLDGLASAYTYSKLLGCDYYFNKLLIEAKYIAKRLKIKKPRKKNWEKFVIVDMSSKHGLFEFVDRKKVIEVIDHRESGLKTARRDFPNAEIQIELVGACATLIFEKLKKVKYPLNKKMCNLIYTAIYSNTLNLKSSNTTTRDLKAIKFLKNSGKVMQGIEMDMFLFKKGFMLRHLKEAIEEELKFGYKLGKIKLGISQLEIYGAEELIDKRHEILEILRNLKEEKKLNSIFLNVPDIKNSVNYFILEDSHLKKTLAKKLKIKFIEENLGTGKLILRKQIEKILNLQIV